MYSSLLYGMYIYDVYASTLLLNIFMEVIIDT